MANLHSADRPAVVPDNQGKLRNYGRRMLQPHYWPQLWRLAFRRLTHESLDQHTAGEADDRCRALAVSATTAMKNLDLPPGALRSYATEFPDRLAATEARASVVAAYMGGGADIDLLYSLCRGIDASRVLETGVAFGWSSLAILTAIEKKPGAMLVSVDLPYLGANLDQVVGMAVPDDLRSPWTLRRGADREELPAAIAAAGPIDLAHYDSDKSYRGRIWAYPIIFDALRPGGILISDDIQDNLAFLAFAEERGLEPIIVQAANGAKCVGILRKKDR